MPPSTSRACIGIDLGGSKVRAAIASADGTIAAEATEPTDLAGGVRVLDQMHRMVTQLEERSGLRAARAAVGSPGVMDEHGRFQLSFNIDDLATLALGPELSSRLGIPVVVENDVNLAALGEQWFGLGRGLRDFAVLSIGTGLGMGLIINGQLHRGARGFAGEVAYLPIGADPRSPESRRVGALESAVGTHGILHRLQARGGSARGAMEVFSAAAAGDPVAQEVVAEEASLVAAAILAICAVVDPELIILSGGIGADPAFLAPVRTQVAQICPHELRIERSDLGERAGVVGAVAAALHGAAVTAAAR